MSTPIDLLTQAGLPLRYQGATRNGEWHGPCPNCRDRTGEGGEDRLCVWPAEGRAWCRRCSRNYTLPELLAAQTGMPPEEARATLGVPTAQECRALVRSEPVAEPAQWQAKVDRVVGSRATLLMERYEGEYALKYLQERGLRRETLRRAQIGACEADVWYERADFGLPPETDPRTGKPRRVCLPAGVLIPYFDVHGRCLKVQTRCDDPRYGRYRTLAGSRPVCMNLLPERGKVRAAIVVESALDALLCQQEVPEGYAFVALGSAAQTPDAATRALLETVPYLLVATDGDEAGANAFARLWRTCPAAVRLVVPPELGADPGEAFLAGLDLYNWCEAGYELALRSRGSVPAPKHTDFDLQMGPMNFRNQYFLVQNTKEAVNAVRGLRRTGTLFIDIETAPLPEFAGEPGAALDPHRSRIRLVQANGGEGIDIFDLDYVPLRRLAPLFEGSWVAHNAVFELKHLLHAGLNPTTPRCTLLAENALSNRLIGLAEAAQERLSVTLDKEEQASDWSARQLTDSQLNYAAMDVAVLMPLWVLQEKVLKSRQREDLAELLFGAQRAVALMELHGIGFDVEAHAWLIARWKKERRVARQALTELGFLNNPNAPAQVADFFAESLPPELLSGWPRTERGQLSTAADLLAPYAEQPVVAAYLTYRRWNDRLKSFGEKLLQQVNPVTGRLHPHFLLGGADTGRMSSSAPNVQGLPRDPEFRALFVPGPGHTFVRADYNQMQLRIAGLLSGDVKLLAAYERGDDVHRLTAARVLGKPPGEVTPEERNLAKAIAFGLLFGMGGPRLAIYARSRYGVEVSGEDAQRIRDRFFETYPELAQWQRDRVADARLNGCSVTPMGRVRNFVREEKDFFHTAAMNTPIQGGEAEVMLAALGLLPDALKPLGAVPVNCVHDELLVECPEENVEAVTEALRHCMEQAMLRVFPKATLRGLVEASHGPSWAAAK